MPNQHVSVRNLLCDDILFELKLLDFYIKKMPTDEMVDHFSVLHQILTDGFKINPNNPKLASTLHAAIYFAKTIYVLLSKQEDKKIKMQRLDECTRALTRLIKATEQNSLKNKMKQGIALVSGIILGIATAAIGGTIGLICGFFSKRPIRGALEGLVTGAFFGAVVGYRLPKKLIKHGLDRKLKVVIDRMQTSLQELDSSIRSENITPFMKIKKEVENGIHNSYTNEEDYKKFLKTTYPFHIATRNVAMIKTLEGHLGQHALIKLAPANSTTASPIFINNQILDLGGWGEGGKEIRQQEIRQATGKMIIHMIAMSKFLNQKYYSNYGLFSYKAGEKDCHSVVDSLLCATKQKPMQSINRFIAQDKWIGREILGPLLNWLSPFKSPMPKECEESKATVPPTNPSAKVRRVMEEKSEAEGIERNFSRIQRACR